MLQERLPANASGVFSRYAPSPIQYKSVQVDSATREPAI